MEKNFLKRILTSQQFAVLATIHEKEPYASLVRFTFSNDLKKIYFLTKKKSQKYLNVIKNPDVSLLIDNRTSNPGDLNQLVSLAVFGKAQVSDEKERGNITKKIMSLYPGIEEYIRTEDIAVVRVDVETYKYARKFGEIYEWNLKDGSF